MSTHRDLINRWFHEVWGEPRNAAAIDELMHPEVEFHGLNPAGPMGLNDFKGLWKLFTAAYPDIHIEVTHLIESGDWMAFRARVRATHATTGRPIDFHGNVLTKIRDGKFIETQETWDFATMMAQAGSIPADSVSAALNTP